ncbi:ATP-dependent RNA helicase dbp6 [Dinochytrium kinnereticum]|nr:ATP-dependent RNA helicase dbp6 [Dinochytrium kinnereticum]
MFKIERFDGESSTQGTSSSDQLKRGAGLTPTLARIHSLKQKKRKERDADREDGESYDGSGERAYTGGMHPDREIFQSRQKIEGRDPQNGWEERGRGLKKEGDHDGHQNGWEERGGWRRHGDHDTSYGHSGGPAGHVTGKRPSWRDLKAQGRKKSKWVRELEKEHGGGDDYEIEGGEQDEGHERSQEPQQQLGSFDKKKKRGGKKFRERKMRTLAEQGIKVTPRPDEERSAGAQSPSRNGGDMEVDDEADPVDEAHAENESIMPTLLKTPTDQEGGGVIEDDGSEEDDYSDAGDGAAHPQPVPDEEDEEEDEEAENDTQADDPSQIASTRGLPPPKSAISSLPEWLSNPTIISSTLGNPTEESSIANPEWGLSTRTASRLEAMGIKHLFPVQQAILPKLLRSRYGTSSMPEATLSSASSATEGEVARHLVLGDLCVSAPTGSGKTLAFALPILEALGSRVITRLRALIVLPTRDLAVQVKATFDAVAKGSGLRIALVTGSTSFAAEQGVLVDRGVALCETSGALDSLQGRRDRISMDVETEGPGQGSGKVDILVATPGRLVDHLIGTPGFTLKHLRFLVLDEADRLLSQSYQGWLDLVLKAASGVDVFDSTAASARSGMHIPSPHANMLEIRKTSKSIKSDRGLWNPNEWDLDPYGRPVHTAITLRAEKSNTATTSKVLRHVTPLQKLLFSATLTRNPAKIASLRLNNPAYIAVSAPVADTGMALDDDETRAEEVERYTAPDTLREHMIVVTDPYDKPLALFHLLFNMNMTGVLVFTKSVEAAHRLAALIDFFAAHWSGETREKEVVWARAISSDLTSAGRRQLIDSFRKNQVRSLICSDVMSRGMDLGATVQTVINYDAPMRAKTYVHRVGRTARAGREGDAYTILESKEARRFKEQMGKVGRSGGRIVGKVRPVPKDIDPLREGYEVALGNLRDWVRPGRGGDAEEGGVDVGETNEETGTTGNVLGDVDFNEEEEEEEEEVQLKSTMLNEKDGNEEPDAFLNDRLEDADGDSDDNEVEEDGFIAEDAASVTKGKGNATSLTREKGLLARRNEMMVINESELSPGLIGLAEVLKRGRSSLL